MEQPSVESAELGSGVPGQGTARGLVVAGGTYLRAGSKLLRPYHPGLGVEPWNVHQVADAGDVAVNPFDLRGLDGVRLAGADVVEVSPPYDHAELTALAAANVVYELLGLFALADAPSPRSADGAWSQAAPGAT